MKRNFFPLLVSICCKTPEGMDMSFITHETTAYSCITCLPSLDAFRASGLGIQRCYTHMARMYLEAERHWAKVYPLRFQSHNQEARNKRVPAENTLHNLSLHTRKNVFFDVPYFSTPKG